MKSRKISRRNGLILSAVMGVWLLIGTAACNAQFSANVQGTVTDSSGAVVPNVAVTLHNTNTGVDLKDTCNGSGFYRFSAVAPGAYRIIAEAAGYKKTSIAANVSPGETRGVDVTLQVGTASVNVTVTAIAPALNPEETRIQNTVGAREISQLPLPNRDVQMLMALTPGVVGVQDETPSKGYGSSIFAPNFNPPYSANGMGTQGNLFLIDDLPVNDDMNQGRALILPNADMISQVALQSQTYSVENGTSSSLQTAFTTKSGGNAFHGAIDYSYAGQNWGAADQPVHSPTFIGDTTVKSVPPAGFHQNLLLASLGGPIIKDRTFFFGSVEKQNAAVGGTSAANPYFAPSFAKWALQTFPNSPAAYGLNWAPPTRDFGGTPKTALDYPKMKCGTTQTVAADPSLTYDIPCDQVVYYVGGIKSQAQPFNGIQWNVRLDQNLRGGDDRVYVMYDRTDQTLGNLGDRPKLDADTPSQNKYFSVNYIHLFSPRLLNEAHFGNLRAISGGHLRDARATSIPYDPILSDNMAQFTFPFGTTPFASQVNKEHTYAFRDTVSYTVGNHAIRAGYQLFRGDSFQDSSSIFTRPFVPFYSTDTFSWVSNSAKTGYSLYTIGGNGKYKPQYYGATSIYNGLFVEDAWKLRRNLTVDAGIRYDDFGNPTKYGSTAQPFVPLFPGSGSTFQQQAWGTTTKVASTAFTGPQNWNFMPRAGFAWSPSNRNSLLLRGGVGLYENALTPFQISSTLPTQPPNRISLFNTDIVPYGDFQTTAPPYGYDYGTFPVYGTDPSGNIYSNPQQTAVYSANLNGFVPTLKPEKLLSYSFGIEEQFAANLVFGISYAGSHGYDLVYGSNSAQVASGGGNADYNLQPNSPTARPTSEWGQINYGRNGLSSNYNALIVTVRQNYKNLSYQANYNWSRALQYAPASTDLNTNDTYYVWKGIYDPKSYYGPSTFDRTNTFSFGGTYEVPTVTGSKLANEAASGWRIGAIVIAQSGTPFTVDETGIDYQNDGSFKFDGAANATPAFPTYTGTKRSGFSRSEALAGVFKQADFANPAGVGTGPVTSLQGANTFRNLGYFNVDANVSKGFSIPFFSHEGAKFYLRGEAVNLFNRTNWQDFINGWAGPKNVSPTGAFGSVKTANQKRFLQIGGRLEF